ncbi:MAG: glutamate-1-semialdehyde 2,1-aminomutase [Deltaproteobacteria bacterium]|nr:glutamate-1-semialdehyde 2,1-aminomutase [Deltaproteobacteria bacterium]NIS76108.1 glutamate-1-semialdehyde 2,1-aminomutase [Deltaproteobacteria bacterium]
MKTAVSRKLFRQAKNHIPGGVNSPVRAFKSVGGTPLFIARAKGSRVWDEDGNEYIDYVGSWGPMILGHAPAAVIKQVGEAAKRGTSFGAPTKLEIELAKLIKKFFPSMQRVRLVSSGTEAAMSAIRLARGYTGRDRIIKFAGCYHGHGDSLLVKAGSGATTLGVPDSPGVPKGLARETLTARFNDLDSVSRLIKANRGKVACVVIEPVPGNMGVIVPKPGFLEGLREATAKEGIVLIFDEVMSGFRVAPGGAQQLFGIEPDLTVLGKIIGGGLPVGAFGGKGDIMDHISPTGPVYQAGTLSGNPLAVSAGLATLRALEKRSIYRELEEKASVLADGLSGIASRLKANIPINRVGSMFTAFFTGLPAVYDYDTARSTDTKTYGRYFHAMLNAGVYLAPSQFEAAFVSAAHTRRDIDQTIRAAENVLKKIL